MMCFPFILEALDRGQRSARIFGGEANLRVASFSEFFRLPAVYVPFKELQWAPNHFLPTLPRVASSQDLSYFLSCRSELGV